VQRVALDTIGPRFAVRKRFERGEHPVLDEHDEARAVLDAVKLGMSAIVEVPVRPCAAKRDRSSSGSGCPCFRS
jgi:hypothetical protein